MIPNATTYEIHTPWTVVSLDMAELKCNRQGVKVKYLLCLDLATKFVRAAIAMRYPINKQKHENGELLVRLFSECWLSDKPRPRWVIPDTAPSLSSKYFTDFLSENLTGVQGTPGEAPWAHGAVERMVHRVKHSASLFMAGDTTLEPEVAIMLAAGAVNRTEAVRGYSPYLWAYGEGDSVDCLEHDRMRHMSGMDNPRFEFTKLTSQRARADECYRKAKALERISVLRNSKVRQPPRDYSMGDWVYIWRKSAGKLDAAKAALRQQTTFRSHWVGPGRVVLSEKLARPGSTDRTHIVWVLLGVKMVRVSVHSVRPATDKE